MAMSVKAEARPAVRSVGLTIKAGMVVEAVFACPPPPLMEAVNMALKVTPYVIQGMGEGEAERGCSMRAEGPPPPPPPPVVEEEEEAMMEAEDTTPLMPSLVLQEYPDPAPWGEKVRVMRFMPSESSTGTPHRLLMITLVTPTTPLPGEVSMESMLARRAAPSKGAFVKAAIMGVSWEASVGSVMENRT